MKISETLRKIAGLGLAAMLSVSLAACSTPANAAAPSQSAAAPAAIPTQSSAPAAPAPSSAPAASESKASGTLTLVWYPNESAADYQPARDEIASLIAKATGKTVEHKLTTDYSIAIEAVASGAADIGCVFGAQGYIEAQNKNKDVQPLVVNSGASGTLDDAIYYSWLSVNKGQEGNYKDGDKYSIANIQGKKISFVSNSSTSGFKVPTTNIIKFFTKQDKWKNLTADDLVEGGSDKFFSTVLFGQSHQGSAVNLLSGKADVAAFCDTELVNYAIAVSGDRATAGSVYEIKAEATAPFDTLKGKQYVIIQSTPVLNGPFCYNAQKLSADDVKKIQDLLTSEEVANDQKIFIPADSKFKGMFKKTNKEHFVLVEDSWYNPIRELQ